ncbi:Chitinase 1 [Geranomyces variabilis]|uniref:chitinase n=1 Tax=Geranomyces variabilis TaxID=109894 RepID=A0AAD5XMD5_9FUNG|nr:Chitinase 1 [Geranomyces variabilis]
MVWAVLLAPLVLSALSAAAPTSRLIHQRFYAEPNSAAGVWESRVYRQGINLNQNFPEAAAVSQGVWQGSVDFTLKIWDGGFCAHLQLINPAPIASESWNMQVTLPTGASLSSSWSGSYTQSTVNGLVYDVTPADWNGKIVSGSSKTSGFCVDFQDNVSSAAAAAPVFSITFSGAAVTPATPASPPVVAPPAPPAATPVPPVASPPAAPPAPTVASPPVVTVKPSAPLPPVATTTVKPPVAAPTPTTAPSPGGIDATLAKAAAGKLLVGYWGQVTDSADSPAEQSVDAYCQGPYDVINIAFANVFRNAESTIDINLASNCGVSFDGSTVLDCPAVGTAIARCQQLGKKVLLSLGGGIASVGFTDAADITRFTNSLWNMFLGGTDASYPRPFGAGVILDGFDLDVEGGSDYGYDVFMQQITALYNASARKFYATAAPQCFFPDVLQATAYAKGYFDWLNIQWYNNVCGNMNFPTSSWSMAVTYWYNWANTVSVNPNVRLLIGTPASTTSASAESFVPVTVPLAGQTATMAAIIASWRQNEGSRFGGVMLWEVVQALNNNDYAQQIRTVLG